MGGSDDLNNLALACHRCNERHYNFTTGIDPVTQQECLLFNPRKHQWSNHFIWMADRIQMIGITATGRATCDRLDPNDRFHNDGFIQEARRYWIALGCHPPSEDPIQESRE